MKSLILFLFLVATVALAEIHLENDPNGDNHIRGLVSLNSLPYFCFVANVLKQSVYGKFHYQESVVANNFPWSQLSLLMLDSLLNAP